MGTIITRQALYDAVWAQPISKLSIEFGLSDVGLAKACRKLSVPIPPRGYWARKTAGKPVVQVALPPRPPGLAEKTTIGGGNDGWGWRGPPDEFFLGDIPPEPTFDEPIVEVRARIEAMLGKTAIVEGDLNQPHPGVATLLRKDEERRTKNATQSYVASWERVLYDTPIQQRRLRLLSSILLTAGRCGCRGDLGVRPELGEPQNDFSLIVYDQRVGFRVALEEANPAKRGKSSDSKAVKTIRVRLGDRVWDDVPPPPSQGCNRKALALEAGLAVIAELSNNRIVPVDPHRRRVSEPTGCCVGPYSQTTCRAARFGRIAHDAAVRGNRLRIDRVRRLRRLHLQRTECVRMRIGRIRHAAASN